MNSVPYLLILLTIFLYLWFRRVLYKSFIKKKNNYESLKYQYDKLLREDSKLKEDDLDLEKTADETIALYDMTREICRYLDANKVFLSFRKQINKYIEAGDCKLLKPEADLASYIDYTVLPLTIDDKSMGYLVASQIAQQDRDKFHILAQQLLLGLRRSFLYRKVQELAIMDDLTGVFSRRHCLLRLNEEIERSIRLKYNFSFLMLDIDHFKDYNDRYGHLVGDVILREVSKIIKQSIRQIDFIGRYGGEEFLIVLSQTAKEQAAVVAERIRQATEYKHISVYDENLKVTISIGVSAFPDDGKMRETLIDKADSALYQAKAAGRNKVCVYRP